MRVKGSTVLLSGATGGIGEALARGLKEAGAELLLTGRRQHELEELSEELGATSVVADLARRRDVQRLIEQAGSVDVLIANAAVQAGGRVGDMPVEELDDALSVNLRAPMMLARGLIPMMANRRRGHIVFVGSAGSRVTAPNSAVYNATKFGLRGFALALRQDLHETGIGVSIVEPVLVRDAGMFVESGLAVPRGLRTSSPQQVVRAVLTSIERNRGEAMVAPVDIRVALAFGAMVPELAARASRLLRVDFRSTPD
ncbi:SDR family NAD(P)-dependent oxidoreductase [Mycobacterium sp. SMC-4]|uniref:SDR family NAD(P)-dependent oxidoreductase n=1 Tax=Mycobacterium sp. SMC-4 TaxID=2857059 RepID=UPI003D01D4FD